MVGNKVIKKIKIDIYVYAISKNQEIVYILIMIVIVKQFIEPKIQNKNKFFEQPSIKLLELAQQML